MTGDVEDLAMYAGAGVTDISDIPPAAEVIDRIWEEFASEEAP